MYLVFNELSGDANVSKYDFNVNERENFTKFIFFLKKATDKSISGRSRKIKSVKIKLILLRITNAPIILIDAMKSSSGQ